MTEEQIVISTAKSRSPNMNMTLIPHIKPPHFDMTHKAGQYIFSENGEVAGTLSLEENGDIVFRGNREKVFEIIGLLFFNTLGSGQGLDIALPALTPKPISWTVT